MRYLYGDGIEIIQIKNMGCARTCQAGCFSVVSHSAPLTEIIGSLSPDTDGRARFLRHGAAVTVKLHLKTSEKHL